jgi:hypothetical protein
VHNASATYRFIHCYDDHLGNAVKLFTQMTDRGQRMLKLGEEPIGSTAKRMSPFHMG